MANIIKVKPIDFYTDYRCSIEDDSDENFFEGFDLETMISDKIFAFQDTFHSGDTDASVLHLIDIKKMCDAVIDKCKEV